MDKSMLAVGRGGMDGRETQLLVLLLNVDESMNCLVCYLLEVIYSTRVKMKLLLPRKLVNPLTINSIQN